MAGAVLSVYSGIMGSGKTYEVVANVILPALRQGRRVVHTVEGLDPIKVADFIGRDVGHLLLSVTDEDLDDPKAWPNDAQIKSGKYTSLIQGGDLIVVDEAARRYGETKKIPEHELEFFRMARHAVSPVPLYDKDGLVVMRGGEEVRPTCNVVLMIQNYMSLHKSVRALVGTSFKAFKHTALGADQRYRLRNFDGSLQTRGSQMQQWQLKYDPKIWNLYKSHATGGASEVMVDKRQVIWRNPKMIWFAVLFFGGIGFAILMFVIAKHRIDAKFLKKPEETQSVEGSAVLPAADGVPQTGAPAARPVPVQGQVRPVLGSVTRADGGLFLILDTPDGVRLVGVNGFTINEVGIYGSLDGTRYSSDVRPVSSGSGAGSSVPGGLSFGPK